MAEKCHIFRFIVKMLKSATFCPKSATFFRKLPHFIKFCYKIYSIFTKLVLFGQNINSIIILTFDNYLKVGKKVQSEFMEVWQFSAKMWQKLFGQNVAEFWKVWHFSEKCGKIRKNVAEFGKMWHFSDKMWHFSAKMWQF